MASPPGSNFALIAGAGRGLSARAVAPLAVCTAVGVDEGNAATLGCPRRSRIGITSIRGGGVRRDAGGPSSRQVEISASNLSLLTLSVRPPGPPAIAIPLKRSGYWCRLSLLVESPL